ncbi:MAG: polysaccharide deacetylase family protein [Lentimicrobium sp.]|jgi:peptidoglycan/xylan/chitin deacetylase (PgdA/CDA1 family)|nr:polysaccharide deacetylase family protein [Lentimicrobium sp.]
MDLSKPPTLLRSLTRKNLTWEISGKPGQIFLTFDDGPIPEVTPVVLQILEQFNAKATFFCVGDNVEKYPDIYQQILDSGHATGNHTFHHLNGWKTSVEDYVKDINKCESLVNSNLFRPPYGRIRPSTIKHLRNDYRIVMWSVLTGDYDKMLAPDKVLENAIGHTTDGSIVVFHDSLKAADRLYYALPRFLEHFSQKGFTFSTIPH